MSAAETAIKIDIGASVHKKIKAFVRYYLRIFH